MQGEVVESTVRVVDEHQQYLVPASASRWEHLLACADVAAAVHHSQLWWPLNRPSGDGSELLRAEISPDWCC